MLILFACIWCQEIWNSPYSNDSFPVYAEDIDAGGDASPSTAMLSELSRSLKITIVGGSIPERSGDELYNTCCVFDADGKLKAKHRKVCRSFLKGKSRNMYSLVQKPLAISTNLRIVIEGSFIVYRFIYSTLIFLEKWLSKSQRLLQQGRPPRSLTQVFVHFCYYISKWLLTIRKINIYISHKSSWKHGYHYATHQLYLLWKLKNVVI